MSAVSAFSLQQCPELFHSQVVQPVMDGLDAIVQWFQDWVDHFSASRPLPLSERRVQRGLPPGIANIGRSCFLNIVLQDLAAEPTFYQHMLNKQLALQPGETSASLRLREQFQTQLRSIIQRLNGGQTPLKRSLQTLMNQMNRLGWKPLNRELSFFERLTNWILGAQGDSFRTYNFIRAVLEEKDFSIDRPHNGYFTNWDASDAPERCVVHLTSDNPDYVTSLTRIGHIAPGQTILAKLTMPLEARINHQWSSIISDQEHPTLYNAFQLKQIHVIKSTAYGAHTYIYKRRLDPQAVIQRDSHRYDERDYQWLRYDDKKVDVVPVREIPTIGISSIVFSTNPG